MNDVLEYMRSQDPRLANVPDEQLNQFVYETQPWALKDPSFRRSLKVQYGQERIKAEARPEMLDAYENDPDMPLLMRSELGRRVASGMANMAGSTASAASMAIPGQASQNLNAYGKELSRMGDIESTAVGSIGEIQDAGDAAGYAGRLLAEQIPQLLVSGPVAGGLKAAGVGAKTAAMLAPVITTFPQEAGSIYQDITDQTGETGFRQRATAATAGLGSAALEAFGGESRALKNLMSGGGRGAFRKALREAGIEALHGIKDEALTEGGQEVIASLSPWVGGGELPTQEEFSRRVTEAAIGGGVTGGAMGGISKGVAETPALARPYVAALQDTVAPRQMPGINSDAGLQPYTGARIEDARNPASRLNPNDVGNLAVSESMADARSAGPNPEQPSLDTRLFSRLRVDPQVINSITSINQTLDQIESGHEVDQSIRDSMLNQSGEISAFLGRIADSANRRNDSTGAVNAVLDLKDRLDNWAKETTAYNDLTAEAIAVGRNGRKSGAPSADSLLDEVYSVRGERVRLAGDIARGREAAANERQKRDVDEALAASADRAAAEANDEAASVRRVRRAEQEAALAERQKRRASTEEGLTLASGQTYDVQTQPEPNDEPAPTKPSIDTESGLRQARGVRNDVTSPFDAYVMSRAPRRLALPKPITDLYDGVRSIVSAVNNNEQVDPEVAADLAVQAPQISKHLKARIENAIADGVVDSDIYPLIDLANQLDAYPANHKAYSELTQEMMTKARRTSERRRGITPTKAPKISPPTESSLPADTVAAPVGGVPVAATAPSQNVSQAQAPVAAPTSKVKPTKAKATRGPGNAQATEAQVAAAPVTEPEPPTPPKHEDGTPVAVGDFVSVRGYPKTGNVELIGEVKSVEGGKAVVRLTHVGRGGENVATREGFAPKQEITVSKDHRISKTEPIKETVPQKRGRKSSMTDDVLVGLQARMDAATQSDDYLEYRELRDLADKGDDEAAAKLDQFEAARAGNPLLRDIQAAYEFNRKSDVVEQASRRLRVQNEKTVLDEYDRMIYSWLSDPKKPSGFSRKVALEAALLKEFTSRPEIRDERNKKRRAEVQKKQESDISTVSDSVLGESSEPLSTYSNSAIDSSADIEEDNPAEAETRREAALARGSAPYAIQHAVVAAFTGNGNKMPTQPKLAQVIAAALSKHASVDREDAEAVNAVKKHSLALAQLVSSLGKQGVPLDQLGKRLSRMFANKTYFGVSGQSLSLGEFTLKDAINSVLDMADPNGALTSVAKKLLSAGVNAKVVVLNDADFDQLGVPAGEVAFYDSNPSGNTILIRQSASAHDYLVMHEAIHAATLHALRTNVKFRNEVGRLRAMAVEALGTDYYGLKDHGSNFTNLAEFIAEGFTNPEFRAKLETVQVKAKGIWSTIKEMFGKIFGLTPEQQSVLDALVDMTSSNFAPDVRQSEQTEASPILFAAKPYTTKEEVVQALMIPDEDGKKAILDSARSTQQLVPVEVADAIRNGILSDDFRDLLADINSSVGQKDRESAIKAAKDLGFDYAQWRNSPERRADNDLRSTLRLADLTEEGGKRLSEITDPRMKREASFVVDRTAMRIEEMLRRNEAKKAALQKAANDPNDPLNAALEELKSVDGMVASTTKEAIADYRNYLIDLRTEAKLSGASVNEQVVDIANRAQRLGRQTSQIGDAMVAVASKLTKDEVENAKTNADLVNLIRSKSILDGSPIQNLLTPADGTPGLLQKYSGLKAALLHIQALQENEAKVAADITAAQKEFAAAVGRKDAGPISLEDFARAYARLVQHLGQIAEVNRKIARRSKDIRVAEIVENALRKLTSSPEYIEQRNEAVRTLDKRVYGINGRDEGNYHIVELGRDPNDPSKLEEFRFLITVNNPEDSKRNAETYAKLLSKIDGMLEDPATSPELHHTLLMKKLELQSEMDDRVEGAMGMSMIDPIGYFRRLPWVRNFITPNLPAWLMNGRLGKRIRSLNDAIDRMFVQIKDLRGNVHYGRRAIILASSAAMNSHIADMPPGLTKEKQEEWWVKNVLEQVLSQNQNIKEDSLKAGDYTRNNVRVTKDDIKSAELMAKWNDQVRKIIESTSGIAQFFPTRIMEKVNGVMYSRLAYATSSLTVPRLLNRLTTPSGTSGSPMDIVNRWAQLKTKEEKAAFLADHEAFDTLALAHVAELNSEYHRNSPNEQVYRELTREWRKNGNAPTSISELVDQINQRTSPDGEMDEDVELFDEESPKAIDQLIQEIDGYTKKLLTQAKETADDNAARLSSQVGQSKRSELNVLIELDGENAFTKPRLEMVAPSSFYRHELATAQSFGALQRGALLPIQLQQLNLITEYRNKLEAAIIELAKDRDRSLWGDFTKEMVRSANGDIYMTRREMQRMLKQIKIVESSLEDALNVHSASSEDTGLLSKMLDVIKSQMLSAVTSLTRNVVTGVAFSRAAADMIVRGHKIVAPVRITGHVIGTLRDIAVTVLGKNNGVAKFIQSAERGPLRVVFQNLANSMQQIESARNHLGSDGYTLKQDMAFRALGDRTFARNQFGQGNGDQLVEAFLSAPGIRHAMAMMNKVVERQERLTNILSIKYFDEALRSNFYNLSKIIEQRVADGRAGTLDFSKPENRFTAKELESVGINPNTWARQLRLFNTTMTMEQMVMDYYNRLQTAKAQGKNWTTVPFTENDGIYGDMIDALGKLNNQPALSNRPTIVRGRTQMGDIAREAVLFPGFANGYLSTLQLMQMVAKSQDIPTRMHYNVAQMIMLFLSLLAIGVPTAELSKWVYRTYYGRPYPAETFSDLINSEVTPSRLARISGAALATTIPYLGEYIASAMGAQNYKAAATDLANMSLPLKLATTAYDAAKTLLQTGDATGAALSIGRGFAPSLTPLINRLPDIQARNAAADAVRVAKVSRGDLEVPDRSGGGYGGQQSEFGATINKALAASAAGDMASAKQLLAKATQMKADAGDKNPQAAVRNAIQSRRPEYKAFGRKLTDDEKSGLVGRMTNGQRAIYQKADDAAARLLGMAPTRTQMGSGNAGPIDRVNKRISMLRKSTKPKALVALTKKVRSLKPKKLKIGKPSAATGSRLLRPRALAKGASALLPAAS